MPRTHVPGTRILGCMSRICVQSRSPGTRGAFGTRGVGACRGCALKLHAEHASGENLRAEVCVPRLHPETLRLHAACRGRQ
eukprot:15468543-Alexandrium_andersonii.AAC.1